MTVKEQCLEKIQGYIDDCDEYKDPEHRYAALVLSIVKRDIELDIKEPAAADSIEEESLVPKLRPTPSWMFERTYEISDPCKSCPTNPSNGGNGICNCTLGLPEIT